MLARLPLFSRLFLRDAIVSACAGLVAASFIGSRDAIIAAIAFTISRSVLEAARSNFSGFVGWLDSVLNVPPAAK